MRATVAHQTRCRRDVRAKRHHVTPRPRFIDRSQHGIHRRRAPRVPNAVYRRRRLVAGALLAVVLVASGMGAQAALTGPGGGPAASAARAGLIDVGAPSVVAMPGDSLWSIARQHHGEVDFERYLDELIDLNGGTAIQAGQLVRLP